MLNRAQTLIIDMFQRDHQGIYRPYKAPHAYQATPPRPHRQRAAWDKTVFSHRKTRPRPIFGGRP